MKLDIVLDDAGFAALEPYWDALLEQSATPTPFLRWDWVRLWWEEFHEDFDLTIAVVRNAEGIPQAIAPLMIGPESQGIRKHLRHLGFLSGLGEVKGERMDFLVPAGREAELTPLLCRTFRILEGKWEAIRLNKLPEESPNFAFIVQALGDCSTGAGVVTRTECLCIQLPESWALLESQKLGKRKREWRRKHELLTMDHQVHEGIATAADAERRLDEFAALHAKHFPEGVSSFLAPRSWRFHRRLGLEWIVKERAILSFIQAGPDMISSIYGLVEGREFYFFQLGWNPDFARYSMGHLGIRWAVQCCIARGVKVFDMLPGDYHYKTVWAHSSRHVVDIEAYEPESIRATLFQIVRRMKRLMPSSFQSLLLA